MAKTSKLAGMPSTLPPGMDGRTARTLQNAERRGLLKGPKTKQFTVKVSPALFDAAARWVGTDSPAAVINAALATLAAQDDVGPWLARNIGVLADLPPEIMEQIKF